ncbi:MAG: hypothetical protein ACOYLX_01965 [Burkholderiaceae bacterium]
MSANTPAMSASDDATSPFIFQLPRTSLARRTAMVGSIFAEKP